jgi:hypothetical protein
MRNLFSSKSGVALIVASVLVTACHVPSDELLARTYREDQLRDGICRQAQQCAELSGSIWFIDESFVFEFNRRTGKKTYVEGYGRQLIAHRQVIFGVSEDQDLYVAVRDDDGVVKWMPQIGDVTSVASDGRDLFVTLEDGEVWVMRGELGKLGIHYSLRTYSVQSGKVSVPVTRRVPRLVGMTASFVRTRIRGAKAVSRQGDELMVELSNGKLYRLRDL